MRRPAVATTGEQITMKLVLQILLIPIFFTKSLSTSSSTCTYKQCISVAVAPSSQISSSGCNQLSCAQHNGDGQHFKTTLQYQIMRPKVTTKNKKGLRMTSSLSEKWNQISSLPLSKDMRDKLLGLDGTAADAGEIKSPQRQTENEATSSNYSRRTWINSSFLVGGAFLLVITSVPYSKTILRQLFSSLNISFIKSFASTVMASLPWIFGRKNSPDTAITFDTIRKYTTQKIIPTGWEALQKMVLMEFWRRVWMCAWKKGQMTWDYVSMSPAFASLSSKFSWSWIYKTMDFLDSALNRGGKKTVEKFVERRVQDAFKSWWLMSNNFMLIPS